MSEPYVEGMILNPGDTVIYGRVYRNVTWSKEDYYEIIKNNIKNLGSREDNNE